MDSLKAGYGNTFLGRWAAERKAKAAANASKDSRQIESWAKVLGTDPDALTSATVDADNSSNDVQGVVTGVLNQTGTATAADVTVKDDAGTKR